MRTLGIRCHKDSVVFVALEGDVSSPRVVEHALLSMPALSRPQQLAWLRNEVLEIAERCRPSVAAFKAQEPVARRKELARAEAEGVIQEAAASIGVDIKSRIKTQIKADIGFPGSARYLDRGLGDLADQIPKNRYEAALAALSAFAHA